MIFLCEFDCYGRKINNNKKISILALHLGYGGVEKSIIDQANMLSEFYDVEVMSLYKLYDYIPYKVNDKVKIKYLSNLMYIYDIPNLDNQRINLRKLVDGMRRWILSLPRILREYSSDYNYLGISDKYIIIKNELLRPDINNNEFIYQRLIEIFDTTNYEEIAEFIKDMKHKNINYLNY